MAEVKVRKEGVSANNQWTILYVDQDKSQTKGVNKEFGFHINRPFYLVSKLPMNRVMEAVNSSALQLRRWKKGRVGQ